MPNKSKKLKVQLSEEVTKRVKAQALKRFTTPPRVVNKVLSEHLPKG